MNPPGALLNDRMYCQRSLKKSASEATPLNAICEMTSASVSSKLKVYHRKQTVKIDLADNAQLYRYRQNQGMKNEKDEESCTKKKKKKQGLTHDEDLFREHFVREVCVRKNAERERERERGGMGDQD